MNVKATNKVETNRYELELEVSSEEFNEAINTVYKRESKKMQYPRLPQGPCPPGVHREILRRGGLLRGLPSTTCTAPMVMEAVEKSGLQVIQHRASLRLTKSARTRASLCKLNVGHQAGGHHRGLQGHRGHHAPPWKSPSEDVDREIDRVRERNSRMITVEGRAAAERRHRRHRFRRLPGRQAV